MSDVAEFLASRLRSLTPEKWDAFVRSLDQRFRVLEEQLGIERRVTDQILQRGLQVIEDGIGPAIIEAEQAAANISAMTDLGLVFFSTSKTSLSINPNPKTLTIPASNRAQFAPALYLAVFSEGSRENGFVGRRVSYNRETGDLTLSVEQTFGSGTFADWELGPIATTEDLEALRDAIVADRTAVQTLRNDAVAAAGVASGAAGDANNAKGAAQAALAAFNNIWYGARDTEPAGAAIGSQYLDISQTPNVVKVLQEDGWSPTVTVSVGGSRQQAYTATEGQTGPFVVDGGFSIGSVNLNGVELFHGNGVTLDPVAGSFTFGLPLVAGDLVVFRGYLANDLVDIYTKLEANDLLAEKAGRDIAVRVDGVQGFTPAQKGRARANIGAGNLAGFRDKIINGGFDIAQLGPSVVVTGSTPKYTLDMWLAACTAGISCTAQRVRNPPGSLTGPHRGQFAFTGTGASGSYAATRIEGVETLIGQVTLSFHAADTVATTLGIQVIQNFGTGGSAPVTTALPNQTISPALFTPSARKSIVFDLPSIDGKIIGPNGDDFIEVRFFSSAVNAHIFMLTRVSLVQGDATAETEPVAPRHIGQEELLCRRYYQEIKVSQRAYFTAASQHSDGSVSFSPMRITPSSSRVSLGTSANVLDETLIVNGNSTARYGFRNVAAGNAYTLDAIYALDARL